VRQVLKYYERKSKFLRNFVWRPFMNPFKNVTESNKQKQQIKKKGYNEKQDFLKNVQQYLSHTRDKIHSNINRTIKTLSIYSLKTLHGGITKSVKRTNIDGFTKYLGLDKSTTSRIVGYTPDYIGIQPGKPIKAKNYFQNLCITTLMKLREIQVLRFFNKCVLHYVPQD